MGRIIWILLLVLGVGGFLICLPLALGGLEKIVDFIVAYQVRIVEGSDVWELWRKPPVPIYLKVYLFNITNPDEIETGAKPILDEIGPYVYLETLEKFDITTDEENDTVRYRQVHTYYFQPHLSNGSVDDVFTFINLPFVAVAKMAHEFTDVEFILDMLDGMLSEKGEALTKTHMVREFLFEGFSVQAYLDLMQDPLIQAAGEVKVPEMIADGKMGLLKGKNGTSDSWWVVRTGVTNPLDFGRTFSWDCKTVMTVWSDDPCNQLNGTDGMLHPPFQTEETRIQFFVPQLCRSIYLDFTESVISDGVRCNRYKIPASMFSSIETNPDNYCFCSNGSICTVNGIASVGPCFEGAPLYISHPHFVGGDKSLFDGVVGLQPDPEKHIGYLDLQPKTGMSIKARIRFQFNMELKRWPAMPTFRGVSNTILPLMWLEEGADIDSKNRGMAWLLDTALSVWSYLRFLLILLCLVAIIAGIFLMTEYKKSKPKLVEKS